MWVAREPTGLEWVEGEGREDIEEEEVMGVGILEKELKEGVEEEEVEEKDSIFSMAARVLSNKGMRAGGEKGTADKPLKRRREGKEEREKKMVRRVGMMRITEARTNDSNSNQYLRKGIHTCKKFI